MSAPPAYIYQQKPGVQDESVSPVNCERFLMSAPPAYIYQQKPGVQDESVSGVPPASASFAAPRRAAWECTGPRTLSTSLRPERLRMRRATCHVQAAATPRPVRSWLGGEGGAR